MKKIIYYAHPMNLYDTKQEQRDIETLEKIGFTILNPNQKIHQVECKKREDVMDYFFELISDCDAIAIRSFPDGMLSAGVAAELDYAIRLGLPAIELPTGVSKRTLTIEQTRETLRELGNR
jgi:nucleoside 2-deoxyribosyltransferase